MPNNNNPTCGFILGSFVDPEQLNSRTQVCSKPASAWAEIEDKIFYTCDLHTSYVDGSLDLMDLT